MQEQTPHDPPLVVGPQDAWGLPSAAQTHGGCTDDIEWSRYEILGDHDDARDPEALGAALAGILLMILVLAALVCLFVIW